MLPFFALLVNEIDLINPNVKVTIAFNDRELEPEELDEQAQRFTLVGHLS